MDSLAGGGGTVVVEEVYADCTGFCSGSGDVVAAVSVRTNSMPGCSQLPNHGYMRSRKGGASDPAAARFAFTTESGFSATPEKRTRDTEVTKHSEIIERAIKRMRLFRLGRSDRTLSCRLKSSCGSRAGMHFSIPRDAGEPVGYAQYMRAPREPAASLTRACWCGRAVCGLP